MQCWHCDVVGHIECPVLTLRICWSCPLSKPPIVIITVVYGKGYGQCEGSKYGQNAKSQKYAGSQNKGRKRKKDPTCIQLADKKKWKCNLIHGLSKHPGHKG